MRIAILGAGFTGLSAAYRLLQKGHSVTIFEKEGSIGGLAIGFKDPKWQWSLEKAYHHWFTSDYSAINLAREIKVNVIIKRPSTDLYFNEKMFPFDSPISLLMFPYLSLSDKFKLALSLFFLKYTWDFKKFEGKKAYPWIEKNMGANSMKLIWDPLFSGKFGKYKKDIALTWFWARIKKRTPSLAYPEGGFQVFADKLATEIKGIGGKINLQTEVTKIDSNYDVSIAYSTDHRPQTTDHFDKIIVTLPSPVFSKISQNLPKDYVKRITSIHHLHAQVLILVLSKPFMEKTYWLNITNKKFPFLVLAEHTNFMDPKNYGGQHILYIGNYLPMNHRYLKMTSDQLLKEFTPFLNKINPTHHSSLITHYSFIGPFAQPIVTTNYPKLIPTMKTPLANIYLANLDMVYPWDRGTNYAIEMGEKVADEVLKKS